ncbi:S8 family serine peptidase [soil metagenome]
MKKYVLIAASMFLTGAAADTLPVKIRPFDEPAKTPLYHTDRVLVHMKAPKTAAAQSVGLEKARISQIEKVSNRAALSVQKRIALGNEDYALLAIDESSDDVESAMSRLAQYPEVESVQPDFIYTTSLVPNDPQYSQQWGLKNAGQTLAPDHATQSFYTTGNPGTAGRDMGLETAWDKITDCSTVVVAVVDTGIKMDHDDLASNLWSNSDGEHGYDFVNSDTDPSDDNGHGTHVAGTIGARGNNAIATTGVCWRVQIMAVKVLAANGSGSTAAIISGIQYAVTNGAKIINMSLGGTGYDPAFASAVDAAGAAGVLLVVAAGNSAVNVDSTPTYPCSFTTANLICVGAVDQKFDLASFSNFSVTGVDIGAPGTNILSGARILWDTPRTLSLDNVTWTTADSAKFAATSTYLQTPGDWNGTTAKYTADADNQIYTTFNMSTSVNGLAYIVFRGSSEKSTDVMNFFGAAAAVNPIDPSFIYTNAGVSGSTAGALASKTLSLSYCAGAPNCSLGFQFKSNSTVQDIGFRIESVKIDTMLLSTQGVDSLNGTSMASPHIAGLAALIKAYNPLFTATDIKNAILATGTKMPSLALKLATGAVANAPAALKYVDAPATVTATIAP